MNTPTPTTEKTGNTPALAQTLWNAAKHLENTLMGGAPEAPCAELSPLPPLTPAAQHWLFETWRAYGAVHQHLSMFLTPNATLAPIIENKTRKNIPLSPSPLLIHVRAIEALLLICLTLLKAKRYHPATLVNEAVKATLMLEATAQSKKSLTGLVNAVLRRASSVDDALLLAAAPSTLPCKFSEDQLFTAPEIELQHPGWWLNKLHFQYGAKAPDIAHSGNIHAPMTLRANPLMGSLSESINLLNSADIKAEPLSVESFLSATEELPSAWRPFLSKLNALRLAQPVSIHSIPEFNRGRFSVQDAAAQVAVQALQINQHVALHGRVLDACAAPGGKSVQIAEILAGLRGSEPKGQTLPLWALDSSSFRVEKIKENRERSRLPFEIRLGDLLEPESWWDGELFDRILLDAPCSSSGSMRRHPDGKWRLVEADINRLQLTQKKLLHSAARLLKPNGLLVYSTCSIFAEENARVFATFCQEWLKKVALSPSNDSSESILSPIAPKEDFVLLSPLQLLPNEWHDGHFIAQWTPSLPNLPH